MKRFLKRNTGTIAGIVAMLVIGFLLAWSAVYGN